MQTPLFTELRPLGNGRLMGCDGWSCPQTVNHGGVTPWVYPDVCHIPLLRPQSPSPSVALQPGVSHSLLGPAGWALPCQEVMAWVRLLDDQSSPAASGTHYWVLTTEESTLQSQFISIQFPETFNLSPGWAKPLRCCCPPVVLGAAPPPPEYLCLGAVQLALFFLSWCL